MTDMEKILVMQVVVLIVLVFLCYLLADLKEDMETNAEWLSRLLLDNRARAMRLENKLEEKK